MKILSIALIGLLAMTGCTATRSAYQAANSPDEVAYVVSEHYSAVLQEAASFVEDPNTPEDQRALIKGFTKDATPLVKELRPMSEAYKATVAAAIAAGSVDPKDLEAVREAASRLSLATAQAAGAVAKLIRQLRAFKRGETAYEWVPVTGGAT